MGGRTVRYWLFFCWLPLGILASAFALFVYQMATLPPLACHPHDNGVVELNCVHGHLAP